jgi:hypothetical protein
MRRFNIWLIVSPKINPFSAPKPNVPVFYLRSGWQGRASNMWIASALVPNAWHTWARWRQQGNVFRSGPKVLCPFVWNAKSFFTLSTTKFKPSGSTSFVWEFCRGFMICQLDNRQNSLSTLYGAVLTVKGREVNTKYFTLQICRKYSSYLPVLTA